MVKILERPTYLVTCWKCQAGLSYTKKDMFLSVSRWVIACPICNRYIEVPDLNEKD